MRDQYDDKNLSILRKLSTIFELPEFVKQASVINEKEIKNLARCSFADTVNRKYPLTTKKDTYLSKLFFTKHASEYDEASRELIKKNIADAMDLWGIDNVLVKKASMIKEAGAYETVTVKRSGDGAVLDAWELRTPRDFEKAAIQLFENKNMFTFEQRKDLSRQLLSSELGKEASLDSVVDEYLEKAAGYGICTKLELLDAVRDRARLYKSASTKYTDRLADLAEELDGVSELSHKHLDKVAAVFDFLDEQTGIQSKYADLPTPEESLFIYTEKTAEEIKENIITLQNGSHLDKRAIADTSLDDFFEKYIGEIPKVSREDKLDILASLPSPEADDFIKYYGE